MSLLFVLPLRNLFHKKCHDNEDNRTQTLTYTMSFINADKCNSVRDDTVGNESAL